jgi:mannosyl-oligosaccharide glucosidase
VPDEYVAQLPEAANPPTLFLPLMAMVKQLQHRGDAESSTGSTELTALAPHVRQEQWLDFLARAWPKLMAWYRWFDRSQAGPIPGSFR